MKKKSSSSSSRTATRKLGDNRKETAIKPRKIDKNFKQSRDVREDRGVRQVKSAPKNREK